MKPLGFRVSVVAALLLARRLAAQDASLAKDSPPDIQFLRDYAATRGFMLGSPTKAVPTPDGKAVLFLRSEARVPQLALFEFDVASQETRQLISPAALLRGVTEKLSPQEKARRERMRASTGGFSDLQISPDGKKVLVSLSGKLYLVDRGQGVVRELKTGSGTLLDPKFSPDGKSVPYVLDHDVYVYALADDRERRVTHGGNEQRTYALAEFVAQEEMDRYTGYRWSPDHGSLRSSRRMPPESRCGMLPTRPTRIARL